MTDDMKNSLLTIGKYILKGTFIKYGLVTIDYRIKDGEIDNITTKINDSSNI